MLMILSSGMHGRISIKPRWPAKQVRICPQAFGRLQLAQAKLPPAIELIITRAFEPPGTGLTQLRTCSRWMGIQLFSSVYAHRKSEVSDIFGANGHDRDGTHVDVSILLNGRRVRLLPLSVFTPDWLQNARVKKYQETIDQVFRVLNEVGFDLHRNRTESLQIHCDLRQEFCADQPVDTAGDNSAKENIDQVKIQP